METGTAWFLWALLSAVFAALTAIFAKIGLAGVDSDLATLVRTAVIAGALAAFVIATGKWANPLTLPAKTLLSCCSRAWRPGLPGAATSGP
jgi:transporter family protein